MLIFLWSRYVANQPAGCPGGGGCRCRFTGICSGTQSRQTTIAFIKSCADIPRPKVAVLVQGEQIPAELPALIADGIVGFVQFHGDSLPDALRGGAAWQAMNLRTREDVSRLEQAWSPAVLLDAWSETHKGGTGKQL